MQKIILASQSPRRKQLLEWAEVPFDIIVKNTDENYPPELSIEEIPVYIARHKALEVRKSMIEAGSPNIEAAPILAADTVVVLDGTVIGKPVDREDAIKILSSLSGRVHQVVTGVVILKGKSETAFSDITSVEFHTLTHEQIIFYIDKYRPYDKAGAYAIQEWVGVVGIKSVSGDFYNVMGLPVSRVVQALQTLSNEG
jgi:septum formation protein